MNFIPQVLFSLALLAFAYLLYRRIRFIRRNIMLGQSEDLSDHKGQRLKNMLLMAFGQKKMFDKPFVGLMHFIIYVGFILINIEILEIILDGILGTHRLFAYYLPPSLYRGLINFFELLAAGVFLTCVVFLVRRNILKVKRFHQAEMTSWPKLDGNLILIFEILLMVFLFSMNASDRVLQQKAAPGYFPTGDFLVSQTLKPLFSGLSVSALVVVERAAWWVHILGILAFAIYVTYSKHLHIGLAFPNTYYARLDPNGKMKPMPSVTQEVKIMLGLAQDEGGGDPDEMPSFGAKDIDKLSWKNLMEAYSCTECGRCTQACPANQTGKKLSPRKIMMDIRDRSEEVGSQIDQGQEAFQDGKSLLDDYISREELYACTSCQACIEACPVMINPLEPILELRRYITLEESGAPQSWNMMFQGVENSQNPWSIPPAERDQWRHNLD